MGALSILQFVLPLLSGVLGLLTKSNAPAEILANVQEAINKLTSVHGTLVTKAQIESITAEHKW